MLISSFELIHGLFISRSLRDKIICDLNKTPDLSQRSPHNYRILQYSYEPSYNNTNVVNALQEPFVVNQDPGAHYGYNCPSKVSIIPDLEPFNNQTTDELPQALLSFDPTCYSEDGNSFTYDSKSNLVHDSPNIFNPPPQPPLYSCEFYGNDARDEHLNTILATESDEFIKSSVENLVLNPSESEGEYECDVPACDNVTTFSKILFDYDFSSNDDQSFYDEDIPKEFYSNPLFDEEIISMKIDPHHFNAESDLIESLLNRDSPIISSSSKIDSLFDEFAGELILLKSIPSGINETDCDTEEEIRLVKRLLYDNSSPHPPKEFISKYSNTAFESFSPFPIPIEDSDSLMEEINLSLLRMTRCRRALRKMTMTLKGIFSSLKNCLAMIPFHFLKMSHFILIFFHPLILLQNHRMLLEKQNNRSTKGYHEVPPPLTGNYIPLKRDLRMINEHFKSESVDVSTVSSSADRIV
uniref:Reverse transcriptase domain-containing protein n=1 Tax=Tanacetum cinerariifolium TaxID=118510 RepID=A0A6L2NUY4_TANCI|nr:hypothetical protein [Tanacetum cinerariifolium]